MSWIMPSEAEARLEGAMVDAFREALELWIKKQADYGPNNIAQAGEAGVALRANDKVQRLLTLLKPTAIDNPGVPANEAVRDSWLDLVNYAAMGLLLRDGNWPAPNESELSDAPANCPHCGGSLP